MTTPNRTVPGYTHIIGSSELGSCLKAQAARFLGYTPLPTSEHMQALYDAGNTHEEECIAAMRADGWELTGYQEEFVIDCGDGWGVVIHVDAGGDGKVIEIKSPATWASFERAVRTNDLSDPYMHRIAWQVSCQMVASGLEAVVACVAGGRVKTFGIEVPPFEPTEIIARVDTIRVIADSGELPAVCTQNDYPCPVAYLHENPPNDTDEILDSLVLRRGELVAEKKQYEREIADMDAAIRVQLGERTKVRTELATVTVYIQAGPAKWDTAAMEADGIEVEKYRVPGQPSSRMKITLRGE